ncbi:MAG: MBL fold metallo-hydrolase [Gammaproteobacteria bacterium]|nr:MBL fold metallo-hydrolase [Gammaproteobacteria bacterium]
MKWLVRALVVIAVLGVAFGGYVYKRLSTIEVAQLTERAWVLHGFGGNVTLLKTGAGAVMVDSLTFKMQGRLLKDKAQEITGEPVVMIINTHFHRDHSHGNPAFDTAVDVVATSNTLKYLQHSDPVEGYWDGDAAELLPNKLVDGVEDIKVGDQRIRLLHPGRGHTDGDLVVVLLDQGIIALGDLFFNRRYPNIDIDHGASITNWPQTLENTLNQPFEIAIPGHGVVSDADGIRVFQSFLTQLSGVVKAVKANGWTLEQTYQQAELTEDGGYGIGSLPFVYRLDREFVLRRAWEEAQTLN